MGNLRASAEFREPRDRPGAFLLVVNIPQGLKVDIASRRVMIPSHRDRIYDGICFLSVLFLLRALDSTDGSIYVKLLTLLPDP
jgi:hypothetical protein